MSEFIRTGLGAIIAPSIFRIVSIDSKPEGNMFRMTATLYHATYSLEIHLDLERAPRFEFPAWAAGESPGLSGLCPAQCPESHPSSAVGR